MSYFSKYKGSRIDEILGSAESHIENKNNPHNVTKEQLGLTNVGDYKAVSTTEGQGLTDAEKVNARNNIGAGTSSFSGSFNDLSDKPTIPDVSGKLDKSTFEALGITVVDNQLCMEA